MDKKIALILLLENSLIVPDRYKRVILQKINALNVEQIAAFGRLLASEQNMMVKDKALILKNTKLLLDTLRLVTA